MKMLYDELADNKDDDSLMYEIIHSEEDLVRKEKLKQLILNLNINDSKKYFLLNQIFSDKNNEFLDDYSFKGGKYSFRDLFLLVNKYIDFLSHAPNPFNNFYPIVLDDKTYLNNIAIFIACLKLNLNPVLINLNKFDINAININEFSENHNFYLCTSGSTGIPKLICLNEKDFVNVESKEKLLSMFKEHGTFYNISNLEGISGLNSLLIYTLAKKVKMVINTFENFDENFARYKANYGFLPLCELMNINDKRIESVCSADFFLISGDFISYSQLLPYNLKKAKLIYIYGSTESYGYMSHMDLCDIFGNLVEIGLPFLLYIYENISNCNVIDRNYRQYGIIPKLCSGSRESRVPIGRYDKNMEITSIQNYGFLYDYIVNYLKELYIYEEKNKVDSSESLFLIEKGLLDIKVGEIFYKGKATGDIGFVDNRGYLYFLFRKDKINSLFETYLKTLLYNDVKIEKISDKNYCMINYIYGYGAVNCIYNIMTAFSHIKKEALGLPFEMYPIITHLSHVGGISKFVNSREEYNVENIKYMYTEGNQIAFGYILDGEEEKKLLEEVEEYNLTIDNRFKENRILVQNNTKMLRKG